MNIINAININKKFNDNIVLDNANLQISKGEVVSILGGSGEGKSTFLRILASLESLDSGEIKINGLPLLEGLKDIGFVFQNFNLFSHLKIKDNIEIAAKNKKNLTKLEISKKREALINQFKLNGKEDMYPSNLSGGQMQRVAIARALMLDPSIILFDEPTSALDPELKFDVVNIIKDLASKGYTILIVTHDLDFAKEVSTRSVTLKDGKFI